jgi:hypothetical protein
MDVKTWGGFSADGSVLVVAMPSVKHPNSPSNANNPVLYSPPQVLRDSSGTPQTPQRILRDSSGTPQNPCTFLKKSSESPQRVLRKSLESARTP